MKIVVFALMCYFASQYIQEIVSMRHQLELFEQPVPTLRAPDDNGRLAFRRFASRQRAHLRVEPFVTQALFPRDRHSNEKLVTIELAAELATAA